MIVKVNVKLGFASYQFEIDERNEMDALHKGIVLANPRRRCNECGNDNPADMYFTSNKDKDGNTYVNVKCAKCGAKSKLGQYKAGGYFWKDFEKYLPKNNEPSLGPDDNSFEK